MQYNAKINQQAHWCNDHFSLVRFMFHSLAFVRHRQLKIIQCRYFFLFFCFFSFFFLFVIPHKTSSTYSSFTPSVSIQFFFYYTIFAHYGPLVLFQIFYNCLCVDTTNYKFWPGPLHFIQKKKKKKNFMWNGC